MTYIFSFDLYKIFTLIGYKISILTFFVGNESSVSSEKGKQEIENNGEGIASHENLGQLVISCKFTEEEFVFIFAK